MTQQQRRSRFRNWLSQLLFPPTVERNGRRILVEPLERRELMAVDSLAALLGSNLSSSNSNIEEESATTSVSTLSAEGEPANDLVAFAKALTAAGVRFFGAAWCPFCNEQKLLFEDGAKFLPFVEVTNPNRTPNQIAIDEGIDQYPTWEFPDGSRAEGVQTLATIALRSGVAIPQSSTPSFATIPDVTVRVGSPLYVPVDAYDPNGNPVTITVTSSNPSLLTAEVANTNRSIRVRTAGFGDMVFELFEDKAPRAAGRVLTLAQSGFFDGLKFHRVEDNFVIQGGDPDGDGTGGSNLGNFDDDFHLDLQHNQSGVLSFAKSTDDTNNSQFFITEGAQRFLDFNHSVFGQLVEGEIVREAISETAVTNLGTYNAPTVPVVINSVTVFNDIENGLVFLKPTGSGTGTSTITVTVTDSEGNVTSQTFTATVAADNANGAPFLNPIPTAQTLVNSPTTINLTSQDAENDTRIYSVTPLGSVSYGLSVDSSTGVVSITPPTDFIGQLQFRASVRQTTTATTSSQTDEQIVTVNVTGQPAPTGIDLVDASDSGSDNADDLTNATSLTFTVFGTEAGATVELNVDGTPVTSTTATGTTTTITLSDSSVLTAGSRVFRATQTLNNVRSSASPALAVTIDRTAPATINASVFPANAIAEQTLSLNLAHPDEGNGLVYGLVSAPNGMTINSTTGLLTWIPELAQVGARSFTLSLTDNSGNTATQVVNLTVVEDPLVRVSLKTVDLSGNAISTIAIGQQFKVQILVEDIRDTPQGVFSAYYDLEFDPTIIQPIATNPITYITPYSEGKTGTVSSGLIDELGSFSNQLTAPGAGEKLMIEVTFTALAVGNANLRTNAPEQNTSDIVLYGSSAQGETDPSRVLFGTADFTVGINFELVGDTFSFDEDSGTHNLPVLANDTVTNGAILTITTVSTPTGGGTVTIASDGKSINYVPAANFNGSETFTYTARNQDGLSRSQTVTVEITDVNDPPLALNDTFTVFRNSSANILNVLANDTTGVDAAFNESLRVTAVGTGSAGGTIAVSSSGLTINYSPRANFTGTETFTYTISDGRGGTATATATVAVDLENPPPTAQGDFFIVAEDAASASFNLLQNDSTSDQGETLSISAISSSTRGSTVSIAEGGQAINYRPGANINGVEIFTYTLRDSRGATATANVTFTITAVNDPPVATDDTLVAYSSQTTTTLNLLANDTNVDTGENYTITAISQPPSGFGSLAISSDGKSVIYTSPSTTFEGDFAFTYTIGDGSGLTDTATVNVSVENFVPRSFRGTIAFANNSGGTSGVRVGGISLRLTGTDITGASVSKTIQVASDGTYEFPDLPPGTYSIIRDPLPYLRDAGQTFNITSDFNATDVVTDMTVSGTLRSEFLDIRDFLGSTFGSNLSAALASNGSVSWYATRGDWSNLSNLNLSVNSTASTATVSGRNNANQTVNGTVALNLLSSAMTTAESGTRLIRIRTSAAGANLTTATTSSLTANTSIPSVTANTSNSNSTAEGEGLNSASPLVAEGEDSTNDTADSGSNNSLSSSQGASSEPTTVQRVVDGSVSPIEATDSAMESVAEKLKLRLEDSLEDLLLSDSDALNKSVDTAIDELS